MNLEDYKGVWVFAEQRDGELQKISFELLGKGREIADKFYILGSWFYNGFRRRCYRNIKNSCR